MRKNNRGFKYIGGKISFICMLGFQLICEIAAAQTTQQLSYESFIALVKSYHPIARQANLLTIDAQQRNLVAKGGFDPKLYYQIDHKTFNDKLYFSTGEGGVKMPTWGGLELKANYNYATGILLNPAENLPVSGQAVLGISANLISGLRIDERRANYRIAKIATELNQNQLKITLNDLILDASVAYWNWATQYQQVKIAKMAVEIATTRFQNLKTSYLAGDKAALDTLEVLIQIQERQNEFIDIQNDWLTSGLELSNYLWDQNQRPIVIQESLLPDSIILNKVELAAESEKLANLDGHPFLSYYRNKGLQLEVQRKLKSEKLLPQLNVSYNLLGNGTRFGQKNQEFSANALLVQNNKFGIQFYSPILYRQERGEVELAKLKILQNTYDLELKERSLNAKFAQIQTEIRNTLQQLAIHEQLVSNYSQLLAAENRKFGIGESSVFLVNARERKLLEAMNKLVKLQGNSKKLGYKLDWAKGNLF